MPITKRLLEPQRRRRVPAGGWSWLDRRFLREHAESLGRDAVLLYFFLAAVADKDGLSYFNDLSIGARLRMDSPAVARAREELLARDLIAYAPPLYQLLSIPERTAPVVRPRPEILGDILAAALARQQSRSSAP
jgi:hypothetical protein